MNAKISYQTDFAAKTFSQRGQKSGIRDNVSRYTSLSLRRVSTLMLKVFRLLFPGAKNWFLHETAEVLRGNLEAGALRYSLEEDKRQLEFRAPLNQ